MLQEDVMREMERRMMPKYPVVSYAEGMVAPTKHRMLFEIKPEMDKDVEALQIHGRHTALAVALLIKIQYPLGDVHVRSTGSYYTIHVMKDADDDPESRHVVTWYGFPDPQG